MATTHADPTNEPARMVRNYFVATGLYVVAFVVAVILLVRYMPSNDGEAPAVVIPQHIAAR